MSKTAGILVVGNEILSGKTADENSVFLARFANRPYSIKLTLESRDASYPTAAHEMLLGELARIDLIPVAGS